jgi:hypothetical protein
MGIFCNASGFNPMHCAKLYNFSLTLRAQQAKSTFRTFKLFRCPFASRQKHTFSRHLNDRYFKNP